MTISARQLGMTVTKTSAGEEIVLCPWHKDTNASAWWNPKKELFYCAVCGGFNLKQVAEKMHLEDFDHLEDAPIQLQDYDLLSYQSYIPRGEIIYADYFEERGVGVEVSTLYGMEWREEEPAAVMPHTNLMGKVIGSTLRYRDSARAGTRYRHFGENTPVWPMHSLNFLHQGEEVIVVEGAFSAMKIAQWFFDSGVLKQPLALLGAKANQGIADCLRPFHPVFLYDGDEAGRNACRKMRKLLPLALSFTLPTSPDDLEASEIESLIERLNERIKAQW